MDMIESLKSTKEEEQNVDPPEESSEEGMADSDNEVSTQMSEGKVVNDGGQNSPSTHKSTRSPKRVKFDVGDCSTKTDDGEENEIPAVQADGLERDSELGNPKESNKSVAPVAKHGRKAAGQEALEEEAMGDDEGNGSPSSPLQVQSDEDPKESNKSEAPVAKRGRKAAGRAGVGAKTRGRKKAQEEALEDDEGSGSPSSPLQVKSVEDAKESKKSVAPVAKRGKKAAVQGGVAARTRGRKAQEEEALGDDEGNVSPSSPLHVKTDDDFE